MPRPRRKPRARTAFTDSHIFALACPDWFRAFRSEDERRAAWPALREQAFALLVERRAAGSARLKPDGWWKYESPEPRDRNMGEAEQLERMKETVSAVTE